MNIILDACAVIAFFRDETGAENVENLLFNSDNHCMIHIINLCEVYYDFYRSGGEKSAEKMIQDLSDINVKTRFDLTANFWRQVSKYKATIKRISLADCFALTLADQEKGILVTSDRKEFEPIVALNICQIDFIR
jgi:PIN domain nuclease of toxin-antitoxin system